MTEPSLTTWNRLEPRPRTDSIARALQAQVRDPLWFLTRQWQFGEFQGEDAASPAWIEFRARFSKIDGWGPPDTAPRDFFPNAAPLEAPVENEPFGANNATAVELGQRFEALLSRVFNDARAPAATLRDLVEAFRQAYPL